MSLQKAWIWIKQFLFYSILVFIIMNFYWDLNKFTGFVHELGHYVAAFVLQVPVSRLTLTRIFYAIDIHTEIHPFKRFLLDLSGGFVATVFYFLVLDVFTDWLKPVHNFVINGFYYVVKYFLFAGFIKEFFNLFVEGFMPIYYENNFDLLRFFLPLMALTATLTAFSIEFKERTTYQAHEGNPANNSHTKG